MSGLCLGAQEAVESGSIRGGSLAHPRRRRGGRPGAGVCRAAQSRLAGAPRECAQVAVASDVRVAIAPVHTACRVCAAWHRGRCRGGTEEGHFERAVAPQATHCRLPESSMSGAESVLPWRLILRLAPPSPSGPLSSSSLESVSFAAAVSACQGRGQGSCGQGQARARVKRKGQASSRDQDLVHALASGPLTQHARAVAHSVAHSAPLGRRSSDETRSPWPGRPQARPRRRSGRSRRTPPPREPQAPVDPPPWATLAMSTLRWQGRAREPWLGLGLRRGWGLGLRAGAGAEDGAGQG